MFDVRRGVWAAAAVTATTLGLAAPVAADDTPGWHRVTEPWQQYVDHGLLLPADRYCGDFDLESRPVFQDIRSRVLTRWDDGSVHTETYAGPLQVEVTNTSTGASTGLNLSGRATATYTDDGAFDLYETDGPVGVGFPAGSSELPQGMYLLTGHHVVDFEPDGSRTLVVDEGTETNMCDLVR